MFTSSKSVPLPRSFTGVQVWSRRRGLPTSFPCLAHSLHAASRLPAQALLRPVASEAGSQDPGWRVQCMCCMGCAGTPNAAIGGPAHEHDDKKRRHPGQEPGQN